MQNEPIVDSLESGKLVGYLMRYLHPATDLGLLEQEVEAGEYPDRETVLSSIAAALFRDNQQQFLIMGFKKDGSPFMRAAIYTQPELMVELLEESLKIFKRQCKTCSDS